MTKVKHTSILNANHDIKFDIKFVICIYNSEMNVTLQKNYFSNKLYFNGAQLTIMDQTGP